MTQRNGRCLCGAVSYTLSGEPVAVRICWCHDCQRLSANGLVNALVPTDALAIAGNTSDYSSEADSGNTIRRRFCPQCGAHLFANSSARPQFTVIRVGTLDDPSSMQPSMNIWVNSAPSWACLDQALESVDKQPAPLQVAPRN